TGYVYQYYFEGRQDAPAGSRYTFQVTADRKTYFPLVVFVGDALIADWESRNRSLTLNERYAVSKMALMQAFDRTEPSQLRREFQVSMSDLVEIADVLGFL